mgnify:CR=1 FL=1
MLPISPAFTPAESLVGGVLIGAICAARLAARAVPEWRGILIMGFALLDPAAAWRARLGAATLSRTRRARLSRCAAAA